MYVRGHPPTFFFFLHEAGKQAGKQAGGVCVDGELQVSIVHVLVVLRRTSRPCVYTDHRCTFKRHCEWPA